MNCYKGLSWTSKGLAGHINWIRAYRFLQTAVSSGVLWGGFCCHLHHNSPSKRYIQADLAWWFDAKLQLVIWYSTALLTTMVLLPQQLWAFPGFLQGCTSVFLQVHSTLPLSSPDKHCLSSCSDRVIFFFFFSKIDKVNMPVVCLIMLYCACYEKNNQMKWNAPEFGLTY